MRKVVIIILCFVFYALCAESQNPANSNVDCVSAVKITIDSCYCYFDTVYNECVYIKRDEKTPILTDGRTVDDIISNIIIPQSLHDENGYYIHIKPETLLIIIDSNGILIACKVLEKGDKKEDIETNWHTAYQRILVKAFRTEKNWKPLICNRKKVTAKYYIPININRKNRLRL